MDEGQKFALVIILTLVFLAVYTTNAKARQERAVFTNLTDEAGLPPDDPDEVARMAAMGIEPEQLRDPEFRRRLLQNEDNGEIHGSGVNYAGDLPPWNGPLLCPTEGGVITQTPADHTGSVSLYDNAYDIDNNTGAALATHDGYIVGYGDGVSPGNGGNHGWGNYIILGAQGPTGKFFTIYAHLAPGFSSEIAGALTAFDNNAGPVTIPKGTVLGDMDDTGNSTNDHLHYGFQGVDTNIFTLPPGCVT